VVAVARHHSGIGIAVVARRHGFGDAVGPHNNLVSARFGTALGEELALCSQMLGCAAGIA
jgi:hypothetical protein